MKTSIDLNCLVYVDLIDKEHQYEWNYKDCKEGEHTESRRSGRILVLIGESWIELVFEEVRIRDR